MEALVDIIIGKCNNELPVEKIYNYTYSSFIEFSATQKSDFIQQLANKPSSAWGYDTKNELLAKLKCLMPKPTNYEQIARNLIANKYPIMVGSKKCRTFSSYIEYEKEISIDGKDFDPNLLDALLLRCGRLEDKFERIDIDAEGNKVHTGEFMYPYKTALFYGVRDYCKSKPEAPPPAPEAKNDYGEFCFNESTLTLLHGLFNKDGEIWQSVPINLFYDNFKIVPANSLEIKNVEGFCFLFSNVEHKTIGKFDKKIWFKNHFGISNYGKQKAKKDDNTKHTTNYLLQQKIVNTLKGVEL